MTTTYITTASQIAEKFGVEKRKVRSWIDKARAKHGEIGELRNDNGNNVRFFSDDEVKIIESFADVQPIEKPVTIEVGNHSMVLSKPCVPSTVELGKLRSVEIEYYEDPLAVAESWIENADLIIDALDEDMDSRLARVKRTKNARQKLQDKAHEMEVKKRIYRERAILADTLLNEETELLKDAMTMLDSLKKTEE